MLGGIIADDRQGNKGNSVEASSKVCSVSVKDVQEGLKKNIGSGGFISTGKRSDRVGVEQNANVGSKDSLHKVAVGLNSPKDMGDAAELGFKSFSGQIPIGKADVEIGVVQNKGRWKRWAREAGV